jgi:phosphohistidine phosphatase SixA
MASSSDGSLINATNNITSNNNLLSNVNTIVMMVGHNPAIERLLNNLLLSPSKSHEASKQSWHDISIKRGYVWCD